MQVYDARTTGMHWQIGKGGGYHYAVAEGRGQKLPATVFLGGPPALILSAIAPLPENVPELMLASLIAGERLPQVHGQGPHPLIANAEFALIGDVPPRVRKPEGPFGDHYGYYSLQHDYPVFEVQPHRASLRRDLSGDRRRQAAAGGLLHRRPAAGTAVAAVPGRDAGRRAALVVRRDGISLAGGGHRQAALPARSDGERVSHPRRRPTVAQQVPARHRPARRRAELSRRRSSTSWPARRPETDLYVFSNLAMDTLDYTGPTVNEGSKGVWMGLGDPIRELPRQFTASEVPAGHYRCPRVLRRLPGGRGAVVRVGTGRVSRASPRLPRSRRGRSSSSAMNRSGPHAAT